MKERLASYRAKRDSSRTPEPAGDSGRRPGGPVFVVQRHEASSTHFDFRLEIDGVLVSWAVPKGPSVDPDDRRLAIRTEDHPLGYADFEGRIPQGEYGAGTVIVWDTGHFDVLTTGSARQALADGHLTVSLHGTKLAGGFSLIRRPSGPREQWLLLKKNDEGADRRRKPAETQPESVVSDRTNKDFA